MASNNAINLKSQGIAYYNGASAFTGIDAGTANYVLTSNGTGVAPSFQAASGGSGIATINTDSGNITPGSTVSLLANQGIGFCGSSVTFSGSSSTVALNVTDNNSNTIIGLLGGNSSISGSGNVSLGSSPGFSGPFVSLTSGNNNTCIGTGSLPGLITGSGNSLLGALNGSAYAGSESYNILLGYGVTGSASESHALRIGNATGTADGNLNKAFICGIQGITVTGTAVLVSSSDQLGIAVSSRKYKENIVEMGDYSSDIMKLRPVTFTLKDNKESGIQSGLIAEEVYETFPDIVVLDKNGEPQTVQYHNLPCLLLNELQKALKRIEILESKL